jgi:methionyl-tRNA formyltransferase
VAEAWRIVLVSNAAPVVARLDGLLRALGHEPVALVTSPGHARTSEAVAAAPPTLDVLVPRDRRRVAPIVAAYAPDLLLCWGFSWLLPAEALRVARLGSVNFHPSLLPRHRGPIPISWALREGARELGLTFHRMDERFDTGPVLAQAFVPLGDDACTLEELGPAVFAAAAELLPGVLERVARGEPGEPQDEAAASEAPFFGEDYAEVDWSRPARAVHDQVRAWAMTMGQGPVRGPWAELGGRRVRITRTSLVEREGALRVACGDGPLWLVAWEQEGPGATVP